MNRRSASTLACATCAAMVLLTAQAAMAQDALGGGNALDANTQVGSGGRNSTRQANPYAGRNSIITGEVIGGREFRGRVGYTAPGDFRGNLGSDSLYRFQSGSAWSGPVGFRNSAATYDQLRFGQGLGVLELERSGAGATAGSIQHLPGSASASALADSRLRYDTEIVTATSASRMSGARQPTTLGTALTTDGQAVAMTASGVRGLTLDQYNERWSDLGLTAYDQARAREESSATAAPTKPQAKPGAESLESGDRVGVAFETRFDSSRTDASATGDARIDATGQADYERMLQNIADRYARTGGRDVKVDPAILKTLTEQYEVLRSDLGAAPRQSKDPTSDQPLPTVAPSAQAPTASPTPGRPDSINPADPRNAQDPRNPVIKPPGGDKPEADKPEDKPVDYSQLGDALRHGEKIERLSSAEQGRFNELMMTAEQQLKDGEYLLAEQRFQRALRFSPGHPLALAGVANAQIGAGLYLSAGYSLRSLFTQHPEMIDATYGEGLLPPRERLDAAITALKSRLDAPADRSACALLLAYLGRQSGDRAMMDEGLKSMQAESADDALPKLLRTVWLEGGAAPKTAPEPEK